MNVGWMQAGFAPILARPRRLRPDQTHPGAVGVVVNAPLGIEQHLDVGGREELWFPVWAVEYADLPLPRIAERISVELCAGQCWTGVAIRRGKKVQHVAASQCAPRVASKPAQHEGSAAAKEPRRIDAAGNRKIRAHTSAFHRAQAER